MRSPTWLRGLTPLDGIAGAVAIIALVGVAWTPKLNNAVARATGKLETVQVSVDVRNLPVANPSDLIQTAIKEGKTNIVIRNQPAGSVRVRDVQDLTRKLVAVQPDGSVVSASDPNRIDAVLDARFLLESEAEIDSSGIVMGGTKLKIGTPVQLEGPTYLINGSVSGILTQ